MKCKERLCSTTQLEIMDQARETLLKYKKELGIVNSGLATNIEIYYRCARCTFKYFKCSLDCKFKEGKTLVRKI